jgi:hypothetical protein
MPQHPRHPMLAHLDALVGGWETQATHRLSPGTIVRGSATFEWLEGGHFLIWRARNEHLDFPDSIAIFGCVAPDDADAFGAADGGCTLRYFDSRGVARSYALAAEPGVWTFWRDWPGFAQRFTGTLSADGNTIDGVAELCEDGATWVEDLRMTYQRLR